MLLLARVLYHIKRKQTTGKESVQATMKQVEVRGLSSFGFGGETLVGVCGISILRAPLTELC